MSKESYARGFCKVAEAAGVDPTELAKFAQQYKTEGYAPHADDLQKPKEDQIPVYKTPFRMGSMLGSAYQNRESYLKYLYDILETQSNLGRNLQHRPAERLRQEIMPKHKAWFDAHTNATSKALSTLKKVNYPRDLFVPGVLSDILTGIYHDEMKRTTSAPPARVSAPAKK